MDKELLSVRKVNPLTASRVQPGVVKSAQRPMSAGCVEAQFGRELANAHRLNPAEQLQQHDYVLALEHGPVPRFGT
jgi:hypothetical protein